MSSSDLLLRDAQTQHGDSKTVDEENIVLIKSCLWDEVIQNNDNTAECVWFFEVLKTEEKKEVVSNVLKDYLIGSPKGF